MGVSIDITPAQRKVILDLLRSYLPNTIVWVYGSRVKWTSRPQSDLDMAVFTTPEQKPQVSNLKEAFEESNLPFRMDLFVWDEVPEKFRKNIKAEHVVLQEDMGEVVLEGWRELSLSELATDVSYGYTESASSEKVGPHFLRITDIQNGVVNWKTVPFCPIDEKDLEKYRLSFGDIVVARTGNSTGENYIFTGREETVFASYLIRFKINSDLADPFFTWYNMRSSKWWGFVNSSKTGSAQAGANAKILGRFPVPLPTLPEQRAIAHILGSLDDKIELNRKMNETLEAMAQALFKSWFVDFDPVIDNALAAGKSIPKELAERAAMRKNLGHARKPLPKEIQNLFPNEFEHTKELGWIPKGWEVSTTGEEFDVTMGQSPPGYSYNEDNKGEPFFQGRVDFGFRYPSNRIYCTKPKRFASKDDTLVSVRAPVGDVNMALENCCIGRGVGAVRHKSGSRSYTYYAMKELEEHFNRFEGEGTVFGSISQRDFKALKWIKCSKALVENFEKWAGVFDQKIEVCSIDIKALALERDTLLPKLLSGELRIPEAEKFVEAVV